MFDILTNSTPTDFAPAHVLFLSNPLGHAREWMGLSETIGACGVCRAFDRPGDLRQAVLSSPAGMHLVAHGSGAYHALQLAIRHPNAVQSLTLIDPDVLPALPDLKDCPSYRQNLNLVAQAASLSSQGRTVEAAQRVIDWWMGRSAWARTSARLQTRFAAAMPRLVAEWRAQAEAPLCLLGLASVRCPMQIVTGRKAPLDIRSLVQVMRLALPQTSLAKVHDARGASHLTHPHVIGPDLRNFIVCNDLGWQSNVQQHAA